LGSSLHSDRAFRLYVAGHTDNQWSGDQNLGLSTRCIAAIVGAASTNESGRAQNRRAESVLP
jgi:outer membrane protein OmpA-like peptidoglycan-associated protein